MYEHEGISCYTISSNHCGGMVIIWDWYGSGVNPFHKIVTGTRQVRIDSKEGPHLIMQGWQHNISHANDGFCYGATFIFAYPRFQIPTADIFIFHSFYSCIVSKVRTELIVLWFTVTCLYPCLSVWHIRLHHVSAVIQTTVIQVPVLGDQLVVYPQSNQPQLLFS